MGYTIKDTASLTGIPAGSISHYFARFNKNKNEFRERAISNQEPPRSSTQEVIGATFTLTTIDQKVTELIEKEDYAKARDFLQAVLLWIELRKKYGAIIRNADPDKLKDIYMELANVHVMLSEVERMQMNRKNDQSKTIQLTVNKEDLNDPNVRSEAILKPINGIDFNDPKVRSNAMRQIINEMGLNDPKVQSNEKREKIKETFSNRVEEDT